MARKVIQVNSVVLADDLVFSRTRLLRRLLLLLLLVEFGGQVRLQRSQVASELFVLGSLLILSLLGAHHVFERLNFLSLLRQLRLLSLVYLTLELDHVLLERLELLTVIVSNSVSLFNFALQVGNL